MSADAILLIVAALDDAELARFDADARSLGMAVLVEVHDPGELDRALMLERAIIGINNRNLRTFEVSLATNPAHVTPACDCDAAGRATPARDQARARAASVLARRANMVRAFLVGEAFMRANDPGAALVELFA